MIITNQTTPVSTTVDASLNIYVQIEATSLSLFGLPNGVNYVQLGSKQSITLAPRLYSYDLDGVIPIDLLTLKYYCKSKGFTFYYREDPIDNSTGKPFDLKTLAMTSNVHKSTACFIETSFYQFDSSESLLIDTDGLLNEYEWFIYYGKSIVNKFEIEASYKTETFLQTITIEIPDPTILEIPLVNLKCRFQKSCMVQYDSAYLRFNPDQDLLIDGFCMSGCNSSSSTSVQYEFEIFENTNGNATYPVWTAYVDSLNQIEGKLSDSLSISPDVFASSNSSYWCISLKVTVDSEVTGTSKLYLYKNNLPFGGTCQISPTEGIAMQTVHVIDCTGWRDDDLIVKYEYYISSTTAGAANTVDLLIYFDSKGHAELMLPEGLAAYAYQLGIYVKIIDQYSAIARFNISTQITSYPNQTVADQVLNDILSTNTSSNIVRILKSGSIQMAAPTVINLANMMNNIPIIIEASVNQSTNLSEASPAMDRRALMRETLMQSVESINPSDMTSVKLIASILTSLSHTSQELTQTTSKLMTRKAFTLLKYLKENEGFVGLNDVLMVTRGIISAMLGSIMSMSGKLNNRLVYLSSDTTKGGFTDATSIKQNLKEQLSKTRNYYEELIEQTNQMVASYLTVNQSKSIQANDFTINYSKFSALDMGLHVETVQGHFRLNDSLCKLVPRDSSTTPDFCSNETIITSVSIAQKISTTCWNGDTEVNIIASSQLELSYLDETNKELSIKDLKHPVDIFINRDLNSSLNVNGTVASMTFSRLILTNQSSIRDFNKNQMITYLTTGLKGQRNSLMIQLKPDRAESIFFYFKFGSAPFVNSTAKSFDYARVFCPFDIQTDSGDEFYQFFLNMAQVNNYKGQVGFGFRPMTSGETNKFCGDRASHKSFLLDYEIPILSNPQTQIAYNDSISVRTILSGCYYLDEATSYWLADGVEVIEAGTNSTHTHCQTTHLTEFAGGFVVLPDPINFEYVFANASITKNPIIYATVIAITCLYILLAILCFYYDRQDVKKTGVCLLKDNNYAIVDDTTSNYYYELIVLTGSRTDAGTDSKVKFILSGEKGETEVRHLKNTDSNRKTLRRGGVDSFVMSVKKPLGDLTYLRIWHDNSGRGAMGSWFLKCIIVHDLQTREKYYFICQNWLAVEKDDGLIDRLLPVSCDKQKTEFKYLLEKETVQNLSDGHLWFSVLARPVQSSFTRLERLTCCFVLMYLSMLMNILYYGIDKSTNNGLKIGPFNARPEQIGIALITNLIIFPPSFLLVQIFRRSRRRVTKSLRLKRIVDELENHHHHQNDRQDEMKNSQSQQFNNSKQQQKIKQPFSLPWWFKIIGYCLAFIFATVSIFFIIVQGIQFGDEKVSKWLTSIVISIFTSILIIQPIQVALITLFFVCLFKKANDAKDFEFDHLDDGKAINKRFKCVDNDDEWCRANEKKEFKDYSINYKSVKYEMVNEKDLSEARERRLKDQALASLLREMFIYSMFIWILVIVAFGDTTSSGFQYQSSLKEMFKNETLRTPAEVWTYLRQRFIPKLKPELNVSKYPYISDQTSVIVSHAILRQLRVKNNSCGLISNFRSVIDFCDSDYSFLNEDKSNYSYSWLSPFNASYEEADLAMENIYHAFQHTKQEILQSAPYFGLYRTYWGSGYVYSMLDSSSTVAADFVRNLTILERLGWIDRQTRALLVEFSLFNANANLFAYCTLLFEFLPSGNVVPSIKVIPMILFEYNSSYTAFKIACNVLYLLFIVYFMIKEIRELIKIKPKLDYFKRFWSYIEWTIVGFSWAAFAMYLYRLYEGDRISKAFKDYQTAVNAGNRITGYNLIRLQSMATWTESLAFCLGFCAALGTLKFLRLLRFNSRISIFIQSIRESLKELLGLTFLTVIVYLIFAQVFYLLLYEKVSEFSTFIKSMQTCFSILLGVFDADYFWEVDPVLGPLFFCLLNVIMIFILINLFLSIINSTFLDIRANALNSDKNELHLLDYVCEQFKSTFPFLRKMKNGKVGSDEEDEQTNDINNQAMKNSSNHRKYKYKENIDSFPEKVDDLVRCLVRMRNQNFNRKY